MGTGGKDLSCTTCMKNWVGIEEIGITETRQTMYVYRNIEARVRNQCCLGKAVSITYFMFE